MNPFLMNSMPIDVAEDLYSREDIVSVIRDYVDAKNQTVLIGVEGVGKTSLLRTVFNKAYRAQQAKKGVLISPVTEFPSNLKDEDIYNHFVEMVLSSVRVLSLCGEEETMNRILNTCNTIRSNNSSMAAVFEGIISEIDANGFRIVIVVDNFEKFTSSKDVTMKHHETLRKMLSKSQYIVATNYDLNEDSLPNTVSGSLYLMTFAGHEIEIGGWTEEETRKFIDAQMRNSPIKFSETTITDLHNATGGIPTLVKIAGQYAYDYILKKGSEENLKFSPLYEDKRVQLLLEHWSKMLTPLQIRALRQDPLLTAKEMDTALEALFLRGLLAHVRNKDAYGNVIVKDNEFQVCCKYFGKYCSDAGKLEAAAAKNPLLELREATPSPVHPAEDVSVLAQEILSFANAKSHHLTEYLREAEAKIEYKMDEYRNLGMCVSEDSKILIKMQNQYNEIIGLKEKVSLRFDRCFGQIRNATTKAQLSSLKTEIEKMHLEFEGMLKEIQNGTRSKSHV